MVSGHAHVLPYSLSFFFSTTKICQKSVESIFIDTCPSKLIRDQSHNENMGAIYIVSVLYFPIDPFIECMWIVINIDCVYCSTSKVEEEMLLPIERYHHVRPDRKFSSLAFLKFLNIESVAYFGYITKMQYRGLSRCVQKPRNYC